MRIVIDLLAYQNGAAAAPQRVLALALALAGNTDGHRVDLLLHAGSDVLGAAIDDVRAACAPLLAPERIHVFHAPAGHGDWQQRAADQLRAAMLADLAPDLVFVPAMFDHAGHASAAPTAVPTVYSLATAAVLAVPAGPAALAGQRRAMQALRQAALLLGADAALCAQLRLALPAAQVRQLDDGAAAPAAGAQHAAATAAALWPAFAAVLAGAAAPAPAPARPRMAYLSPLPPQHSGIADYSVELLAQLEQYYDIELIVDQPGPYDEGLGAVFPLRSVDWFERHAHLYQRVLYHFGNSGVHSHMFDLLRRQPGIVVLHDFFLSGVLDNMERDGTLPHAFMQALYHSHGYTGLLAHQRQGRNPSIWQFPCNKEVLDHASGVIVHADYARRLAQQWYGAGDDWQTVPLIRGLPAGHDRAAARTALDLADDDFLICSFGMMGVTKLNDRLLDAFLASPLAADPRCRLVFVGAADAGPYGRDIARKIAASPAAGRVRITGFATTAEYHAHLAASDAAVQLRSQSRGETSASVLDCLLYGLPTVINAHGSSADLPAEVLVRLDDDCDSAALAAALQTLRGDAAGRAALAQRALAYMEQVHAPQQVGRQFHDAIETLARRSPASHYRALLDALHRLGPPPSDAVLIDVAGAVAANALPRAPRQLFVDISALVQSDLKTGIQRVVRSILLGLIEAPPDGYRIEPVYSDGGNRPYRYARAYSAAMLGTPPLGLEDAPLETRAGDLFLGLDLFTNGTAQNRQRLLAMRRDGVRVHFVVYDLLPVLQPHFFPAGAEGYFADYLDTIGAVADGLVCISRAVADELHDWLAARPPAARRAAPLQLGYFHLGADIDASAPSAGLPDDAAQVMAAVAARPSLLMVGTLEPRKGQAQALAACELLWRRGVEVNLVIVGKQGWMVEALARALQQHPERARRLHWLPGVSDQMLLQLYGACSALLAASVGEGFGLPLIEAAQHGLPVIARDLPVFREVGGAHAHYFDGADAAALAATLQQWLALHAAGTAPQSRGMGWLTWRASTAALLDNVIGQRWHRALPATPTVSESA